MNNSIFLSDYEEYEENNLICKDINAIRTLIEREYGYLEKDQDKAYIKFLQERLSQLLLL